MSKETPVTTKAPAGMSPVEGAAPPDRSGGGGGGGTAANAAPGGNAAQPEAAANKKPPRTLVAAPRTLSRPEREAVERALQDPDIFQTVLTAGFLKALPNNDAQRRALDMVGSRPAAPAT